MLIRRGIDSVIQNQAGSIRSRPVAFQSLRLIERTGRCVLRQQTTPSGLNRWGLCWLLILLARDLRKQRETNVKRQSLALQSCIEIKDL